MKDQFVTYEIALKLKELGFNEKCLAFYFPDSKELAPVAQNPMKGYFNNACSEETIHAPLWQQVINWFREKELPIDVYTISGFGSLKYSWDILTKNNVYHVNHFKMGSDENFYKMREQSILKAIEIITDKKIIIVKEEIIPYCTDCGNEDLEYIDQYANGNYWKCKECEKKFIY